MVRKLSLTTIAKFINLKRDKKWDFVIAVDGDEGTGKSDFAMTLCELVYKTDKTKNKTKFNYEDNIVFAGTPKTVKELLEKKKRSILLIDEAIRVLFAQKWQNSIELYQTFALIRKDLHFVPLLIPNFIDLNRRFANHRIRFRFHIVERGYGVVFKKDTRPFVRDKWHMDKNEKIQAKQKRYNDTKILDRIYLLSKLEGFVGYFTWKPLDEKKRKKYEDLRELKKYEDLSDIQTAGQRESRYDEECFKYEQHLMNKYKYTQKQCLEISGTSRSSISRRQKRYLSVGKIEN